MSRNGRIIRAHLRAQQREQRRQKRAAEPKVAAAIIRHIDSATPPPRPSSVRALAFATGAALAVLFALSWSFSP